MFLTVLENFIQCIDTVGWVTGRAIWPVTNFTLQSP